MARIEKRLTARAVAGLNEPGYYSDGSGLYLQVSKTLLKSWLFIYNRAGKQHEVRLGSFLTIFLAEARKLALEFRKQLADGIDSLKKRKRARSAALADAKDMTFHECSGLILRRIGTSGKT